MRQSLFLLEDVVLQRVLGDVLINLLEDEDKTGVNDVLHVLNVWEKTKPESVTSLYSQNEQTYEEESINNTHISLVSLTRQNELRDFQITYLSIFNQKQSESIYMWLSLIKKSNIASVNETVLDSALVFWRSKLLNK